MYSIILALLVSVIIGSCLYGKDFWEKRINVLFICLIAVFAAMLSTSLVFRHNLPLISENWQNKKISEFYVDSIKVSDSNKLILKDSSINMYKKEASDFSKRVITDTVKNSDGTFTVKYTPTEQVRTHLVLFKEDDRDTSVWFVTESKGDFSLDYYTLGNDFYIIPTTIKSEDSLMVKFYSISYTGESNWTIPFAIPIFRSYHCLYVPQSEYDILPEAVKIRTKFPGVEEYIASL